VTLVPRRDFFAAKIDQVEDRLYEYDRPHGGEHDGRRFDFAALDRHGAKVGAIAGYSWARMAEIKQLWVAETHRGRGLAPALSQGFDQVEARWLQSVRPIWPAASIA
jgi:hypothetical protein